MGKKFKMKDGAELAFTKVHMGRGFRWNNKHFIKTEIPNSPYNAIGVFDGVPRVFPADVIVMLWKACVVQR